MTRSSWVQLKEKKLDAMSTTERAEYDRAFAEAKLAADQLADLRRSLTVRSLF